MEMKIAEIEKLNPQDKLYLIQSTVELLSAINKLFKLHDKYSHNFFHSRVYLDLLEVNAEFSNIRRHYISERDQNKKQVNKSVELKDIKPYRFGDYSAPLDSDAPVDVDRFIEQKINLLLDTSVEAPDLF